MYTTTVGWKFCPQQKMKKENIFRATQLSLTMYTLKQKPLLLFQTDSGKVSVFSC